MYHYRSGLLLSLFLLSPLVSAKMPTSEALTDIFQQTLPSMTIDEVSETPIPGLYEVVSGSQVFYTSEDGRYVIQGDMVDVSSSTPISLTEEKNKSIRLKAMDGVNEDTMIVFPAAGEKKARITVFTDIDCPYCQRLHQEIGKLNDNGIEVRYIAFPRTGAGSPSYEKAISVWCSEDTQQAMTDAKNGKSISRGDACSGDNVGRHMELVRELGLNVTPVIMLDSGTTINGYVPADRLTQAVLEEQAGQ